MDLNLKSQNRRVVSPYCFGVVCRFHPSHKANICSTALVLISFSQNCSNGLYSILLRCVGKFSVDEAKVFK